MAKSKNVSAPVDPVAEVRVAYEAALAAHEAALAEASATKSPLDAKYADRNTRGEAPSGINVADYRQGSYAQLKRALAHVHARRRVLDTAPALAAALSAYRRALDDADGLTAILAAARQDVLASLARVEAAPTAANTGLHIATCVALADAIRRAAAPLAETRKAAGLPAPAIPALPSVVDAGVDPARVSRVMTSWVTPPTPAPKPTCVTPDYARTSLDDEERELKREIRKLEAAAKKEAEDAAALAAENEAEERERVAQIHADLEADRAHYAAAMAEDLGVGP